MTLKRVLLRKHKVRANRFFGEAFVASHLSHDEGYYSSFQWITSGAWADADGVSDDDAGEFRRALATHFPRLGELQAKAAALAKTLDGVKPAAPDLWLISNNEHHFIEVKLTGDELAPHQYAGWP